MRKSRYRRTAVRLVWCTVVLLSFTVTAMGYPLRFNDDMGNPVEISRRPQRVVSLLPSVTEVILKINADDALVGCTQHSIIPKESSEKQIVGGFFSPSMRTIKALKPQVIFYSGLQKEVIGAIQNSKTTLICLRTESLSDSFEDIRLLGRIFDRQIEAAKIVADIQHDLDLIARKVAKIPPEKRRRVIRLMGRDQVMTPGMDAFQNEMIRAAGGIAPDFGKKGAVVPVTLKEWKDFNPQVVYGCGGDRKTAARFFDQPGWKDVQAVANGAVYYFDCDLTCRAATQTGYFVSWLAATIYPEAFSIRENQVLPEAVYETRPLDGLDLEYVKDARIAYSNIFDFPNKTLIVEFDRPMTVVSTLEGQRSGILSVGNHYSSPPTWGIGHRFGLEKLRRRVYQIIGKSEADAAFLFTGADMDNLVLAKESYKALDVYALATGGVETNAQRMSKDTGFFYEPGTINIIILTNMQLSPRAMTRTIIAATEGKTAALLDMDVRSCATPLEHRATGTGTDNMIVVQGTGRLLNNAGGHSKLGELAAKAVYRAVQKTLYKQNALFTERSVFRRLKERGISVSAILSNEMCDCVGTRGQMAAAVEKTLLEPCWANFIEAAMVLSDDYEKGLINDLSGFSDWCRLTAEQIAGHSIAEMKKLVVDPELPPVQQMALNAVVNGVYHQRETE